MASWTVFREASFHEAIALTTATARGDADRGLTVAAMNDEDGPYFAELLRVLGESGAWAARIGPAANPLRPAPRSPLRGDDDRAHPYEVSHAAWHSLSHAVDHLSCLRALLGDAKVVHMYAPFSLVRSALENACAAVWMLQPPRRADRLVRRLRFAVTDSVTASRSSS